MKCDNCGKDVGKFCYQVPQGVYGNRKPWAFCTKKCLTKKIKEALDKKKEKENGK